MERIKETFRRVFEYDDGICPYWVSPLDPDECKGTCSIHYGDCILPCKKDFEKCKVFQKKR